MFTDTQRLRLLVLTTLLVLLAYCVAAARAVSGGAIHAAKRLDREAGHV